MILTSTRIYLVLILVLMEYGLRVEILSTKDLKVSSVLILVLMEYGLRANDFYHYEDRL